MKSSHHSSNLGILSILAAIALPLVASAATTVPTPKKTVAPHLSDALSDAAGEISVLVDINEYGFVTDANIESSTNAHLNEATIAAIHQWTFAPAQEDGVAIPSKAIQPFYFNQGSIVLDTKKAPEDTHPIVKNSVKPDLTDDLKNITGEVVLQASLDADGQVNEISVKSSTHGELEATASEALQKWSFKPAIKSGEAVASKIIIPFRFNGDGKSHDAVVAAAKTPVDKAPIALRQPTPELPREIRKERGEAKLAITVDSHGYVADVDVLESTNDALSTAAREAALQWKFKPAIKDGVAVASKVIQPFSFNGGILTADLPVDSMPTVKRSRAPELPKALAKVQGFVKVRLSLDAQGNVLSASCTKSSHDELIAPTVEAAQSWSFKPAIRDGENVPSSVIVPFVFNERS
ncbi:TonB family C-terminal domain protein [Verrucomicrobiia bacterium DG1235]|nr:TonB family C-terminal domain protein [Verrucomicrobiae bacterium DG1235]